MKLLRPQPGCLGFTLIELLVVITIIAILAGIALPVFSRVQERARALEDASNLRQLGIAMVAYINDNDDNSPAANSWVADTPGGGSGTATTGLYNKYVEAAEVFHSPFDSRAKGAQAGGPFNVSYGMNSLITGADTNTGKWKNSSKLVLLAPTVSGSNSESLTFSGTSAAPAVRAKPDPAPKLGTHNKGGRINVLFADSHVESILWTEFTSTATTNPPVYWDPTP